MPGVMTRMTMDLETLQAELEQLFDLDELMQLASDVLGFEPDAIGGTSGKGSFASALVGHCARAEALEALCDAVVALRADSAPVAAELRKSAPRVSDELTNGDQLGPYLIVRQLGVGRAGISYLVRKDRREMRLKVLRAEATRDRASLARYMAANRLVSMVMHPVLPVGLSVGEFESRVCVAHEYVEGQTLATRIARTGPMHLNEAWGVLTSLLQGLSVLHGRGLAHGDLRLENVVLFRDPDGEQRVLLLDAGTDRLRVRPRVIDGQRELDWTAVSPRTTAPEVLGGMPSDARSDLYALGATLYEVLGGRPPFDEPTPFDMAIGHLTRDPVRLGEAAPRGWVSPEVEAFIHGLMAKDPSHRPPNAQAVLKSLGELAKSISSRREPRISDEEVNERIEALLLDPESEQAALGLEAAVDAGADAHRIVEALTMAGTELDPNRSPRAADARRNLLFRAAMISESAGADPGRAEQIYGWLAELDPRDQPAILGLEKARRKLGKYEEVIEMLLARSEQTNDRAERSRLLAEIGKLCTEELDDSEQSLLAYAKAFCEDPTHTEYAERVERMAGTDQETWGDVLAIANEALSDQKLPAEARNAILLRAGQWYADKALHPELALPCFQAVVAVDPGNEAALDGMANIYRKGFQWSELGMVLLRRADTTSTPPRARDLRTEAADILAQQLNDTAGASELYARVLTEDPTHLKASEGWGRILERSGDNATLARVLEGRAQSLRGEERLSALCRIAETYEDKLGDSNEAIRRYEAVLTEVPEHDEALRGLDRLYAKTGRFKDLLAILEIEARLAETPRAKIALLERTAAVYEEEFLEHRKAAEALERVLEIDPNHEASITSLVRHYRALSEWDRVAQLYERLLDIVTDNTRWVPLALQLGRVLADQLKAHERAMEAFERVLAIQPEHSEALEMLARLREHTGDADAALDAIDALAARAVTPEARAEQYLRAARLLQSQGNLDGAIDRYQQALDAKPGDAGMLNELRAAYLARGDIHAALQLLERQLEQTEGDRARAKLHGERALLARRYLKDNELGEMAAKRALELDPANLDALCVAGDVAFEAKRFLEASKHYAMLADRADSLDKEEATRILVRFVDALSQTGSTEKAVAAMDTLLRIAPDNGEALARVAQVTFEHGSPQRAAELLGKQLELFGDSLSMQERATALYRYGESMRRAGQLDAAVPVLEEALAHDPSSPLPHVSLAKLYEDQGDWVSVIRAKSRHLDVADGDERVQLLTEMGELAADKLKDRTWAAKSFAAALEERPDDRRLLTRLMQVYSEEKDWGNLVDVVLRLADFVEDSKQKAKYLNTAAIVISRELGDIDRALEYYEQVLDLDPSVSKAFNEAIELYRSRSDHRAVERLLKRKLEGAIEADGVPAMLEAYDELADLYENELGWVDQAIDACEAAQALDPEDRKRTERLAHLYASRPEVHLEKAVSAFEELLHEDSKRADIYRRLRKLYTEAKKADGAWCLCQALSVLKFAEPDEQRFYRRMRSETAAPARAVMTDEDWHARLTHPDSDPLLTSLFALIEPVVIAARAQSLEALGYDPERALDLETFPLPMPQTLHYAAGVLGLELPPAFENERDLGGLAFLNTYTPSIALGRTALSRKVPPQAAAFIAGRHLSYYRPGAYMRQLMPTGTGLKSWLFGAFKVNSPQFPVTPDLEGPVAEAHKALDAGIKGATRDQLSRVVSRLLQEGAALDLKRWVGGVDLTADRIGLVIAHDLATSLEIIAASEEGSSVVPRETRQRELVLYSVSHPYLELRERLGISIDS
jgi:tetratricopeptide (TPR) repeat protein